MANDCPIRALIISPRNPNYPQLSSASNEVGAAASKLNSTLLQGDVIYRDIVNALDDGPYDIMWWSTHAGPSGVVLSDGVLPRSQVVSIVRASRAKLVFFNTCESIQIAIAILRECDADVVATLSTLEDIVGMRTGILFASQLALTCDFRSSYESSKPGEGDNYVYLSNYRSTSQQLLRDDSMPTQQPLQSIPISDGYAQGQKLQSQQIERMVVSMDKLKDDISSIKTDVAVLKNDLASVRSEIVSLKEKVDSHNGNESPAATANTLTLLISGLILVGIVVILVYVISNGIRP